MMHQDATPSPGLSSAALLRLLQLASPALPVGAYSYSHGLEWAVEAGWVRDEASAQSWMQGLLTHLLAKLDVPVLARLYAAWSAADYAAVEYWSYFLRASRESAELQDEDRQLGAALAQVLMQLEFTEAVHWARHPAVNFANLFALAAVRWAIPLRATTLAYLWTWLENQVAAAIKLAPLGQSAGQRILAHSLATITDAVDHGLQLNDDAIGGLCPGLGIASAKHQQQYTRLFRS